MATLNEWAAELGIDVASLKPEAVTKFNGYLAEADGKYQSATQAQKDAEAKLAAAQSEQQVIESNIAAFGMTENNVIALRANAAAMKAQLEELKKQGLDVTIPELPAEKKPPEFDPNAYKQDVNTTILTAFKVNNRFQRVFGKPLPDDVDVLAREALEARMPFDRYVDQKYDITGEEKRHAEKSEQDKLDAYAAKKLEEYKTKNPVYSGNPELERGRASRAPYVLRPNEKQNVSKVANMGIREKIAASVRKSEEAIKQQSA